MQARQRRLASRSRSWACPSRAGGGALALVALAVGLLACGDPVVLIFDAGSDASVGGTGGVGGSSGSVGIVGISGGAGSSGAGGSAGSSGGAGAGGGMGGLDAGALLDAGADASDASR